MFCPSCGSENPDGAKFCSVCGTAIGAQDQNQKIRTHTHEASFRVPSISTDWLLSLSLMEKAALGSAAVVIIAFFLPLITFEVFGVLSGFLQRNLRLDTNRQVWKSQEALRIV